MKTKIIFILITTFLALGCKNGSEDESIKARGVSQGNGMQTYLSVSYKFSIQYSSDLKLNEKSPQEITIDNTAILKSGETTSSLKLKVLDLTDLDGKQLDTADDLHNYLIQQFPNEKWEQVEYRGATGYVTEKNTAAGEISRYYIITQNKNILRGDLEINSQSNGSDLVKSVLTTFSVDITSPTVSELKFSNSVVDAGKVATLLFNVIDDVSGLNLQAGIDLHLVTRSAALARYFYGIVPTSLGNDWYSIDLPINLYCPNIEYMVFSLSIKDNAGNKTLLYIEDPTFYTLGTHRTKIPVAKITVNNKGLIDIQAPSIHEVELPQISIEAGQNGNLQFRATDDIAGINLTTGLILGTFSNEVGTQFKISAGATAVGHNWYSLDFSTSPYLPAGDYYLTEFELRDLALNRASLRDYNFNPRVYTQYPDKEKYVPVVKLTITNKKTPDIKAPVMSEIKLSATTIDIGQNGKIIFKATDDVSGLDLNSTLTRGIFYNGKSTYIKATGLINSLGNDWYELEFTADQYVPPGDYTLWELKIDDVAQNETVLTTDRGNPAFYIDEKYKKTTIPVVKFTAR